MDKESVKWRIGALQKVNNLDVIEKTGIGLKTSL